VALRGSLVFNLGGVAGSVLAALAMNRYGSTPVVRALAVLGVVATAALGLVSPGPAGGGVPTLLATMAVAGVAVLGLQVTMYGVAANAYPTALRATGVGWALGVARAGGVLSSFAGAALLALAPGGHAFFFGIAAVLAVAALGVAALRTRIAPLPLGGRRRVDPV
jgi:AAHS family 4-hydroxybenzoate transporter-like MFS transporter